MRTLRIVVSILFLLLSGCASLERKVFCQMPATWCSFDEAIKQYSAQRDSHSFSFMNAKGEIVFLDTKVESTELKQIKTAMKRGKYVEFSTSEMPNYAARDVECELSIAQQSKGTKIRCFDTNGSGVESVGEYDSFSKGYDGLPAVIHTTRNMVRALLGQDR